MKLAKLTLATLDTTKEIMEKYSLDWEQTEVDIWFDPSEKLLYESTLTISLSDEQNSVDIKVADYYLSNLTNNLGKNYIGRDFPTEFISALNDLIQERSAK